MILMTGQDKRGVEHLVRDDSIDKPCGTKVAICGAEVTPSDTTTEGQRVQCFYCNHSYDQGVHLMADLKTVRQA